MSASSNSAGDVTQHIETFHELFTHVKHALGVEIPIYLQNILWFSGFDNRVSLRSLSKSDLDYLRSVGRSTIYYESRKRGVPHSSYYGNLCSVGDHTNFTIPRGHERLLIAIPACLQETQKPVKTSYE